ncbi:MAG: glutathione-disulfide reductase [Deltaproteobacteria bacterium]|nr:glutathione-disulfide reductase [Deltaproteobacteria bacterium]
MADYDYDLYVIGGGSGGVRAARMAAGLGARVALAESGRLGGTCVNVGCVPKKLMVYASHYSEALADAADFGWIVGESRFDWASLQAHKDAEIERLNGIYAGLLEDTGVTLHRGHARLVGPHEVEVEGTRHRAAHILLATGGRSKRAPIEGNTLANISDDVFAWKQLPKKLVVAGGGYIATELACVLHGLGAEVHLVHRRAELLRGFDADVRTHLTQEVRKRGLHLHMERTIERITQRGEGRRIELSCGTTLDVDVVLSAMGREPNTEGLGLEDVGVELDERGAVRVDASYRTNLPSVLAVGDLIGRVQLTPMALAEGMYVAHELFGEGGALIDYDLIPTAVFSQPEVGTVGLPEHEARERYPELVVYRSSFRPMKYTLGARDERALVKLLVDGATDRVVGCHIIGPDAGEITQGVAIAMTAGATKRDFDRTLGIHPTLAEELVSMRTPVANT